MTGTSLLQTTSPLVTHLDLFHLQKQQFDNLKKLICNFPLLQSLQLRGVLCFDKD